MDQGAPSNHTNFILVAAVTVFAIGTAAFFLLRNKRLTTVATSTTPSKKTPLAAGSSSFSSFSNHDSDFLSKVDLRGSIMLKEVQAKWNQPLAKLPAHVDLPRLGKKIEISHNGVVVWVAEDTIERLLLEEQIKPEGSNDTPANSSNDDTNNNSNNSNTLKRRELSSSVNDLLFNILLAIATPLETPEMIAKLKSEFPKCFPEEKANSDAGRRLANFFDAAVGDDSKLAKVLKASNQSVVSPAVVRLKSALSSKFPYKDIRGGWRLYIEITDEKNVVVRHTKLEQSFDEESFKFQWQFEMMFDCTSPDTNSIIANNTNSITNNTNSMTDDNHSTDQQIVETGTNVNSNSDDVEKNKMKQVKLSVQKLEFGPRY